MLPTSVGKGRPSSEEKPLKLPPLPIHSPSSGLPKMSCLGSQQRQRQNPPPSTPLLDISPATLLTLLPQLCPPSIGSFLSPTKRPLLLSPSTASATFFVRPLNQMPDLEIESIVSTQSPLALSSHSPLDGLLSSLCPCGSKKPPCCWTTVSSGFSHLA